MNYAKIAAEVKESVFTWTAVHELAWLAGQAAKRKRVLEIGTYFGASALVMARALPEGGKLVCVDSFTDEGSWEQANANLRSFIDVGEVELVRADSRHVASMLIGQFDMIWIDAGHYYEHVMNDIQLAQQVAAPNALICGHDFHGEVEKAVRECYPNTVVGIETIWVAEAEML